ncbi:hypothetical protein FOA43_000164 [Brettanomyces nanus]|uniref:Uncharacterized protein n=1 Tax=Eeniella nana TaxID=13502 RepID=A0A875RY78_EENNA|nr:uncharacterized protein FOA43_000164 [Brettanomyces nanus]QPG72862.1 hypothetical protein FOA43_000164 [Brettanomyces nanus]
MPSDKKNYTPLPKGLEGASNGSVESHSAESLPSAPVSIEANSGQMSEDPPPYEQGGFEQFEIEDPVALEASSSRPGLLGKAEDLARNINTRIFTPINEALDPVYEAWRYISSKIDACISKVGNPLIVKRLLYVLFVAVLIYMISASSVYGRNNSYYGSFHDLNVLSQYIEDKIDPHRLEENLEYLSSMPHMAGTAGDLSLARYIEEYIKKTNIRQLDGQPFQAFTEYPSNDSFVNLVGSDGQIVYNCYLVDSVQDGTDVEERDDNKEIQEIQEETSKDSNDKPNDISHWSFNPGSRSGSATGKVVYANYGLRRDYDTLESYGIDLSSFVALVKYGGGIPDYKKIQYAKARGAVAVLFISDPVSDSPYSLYSIQREPVAYPDIASGNIIDPGPGSADKIPDYFDSDTLLATSSAYPEIPSIPISWADFIEIMDKVKETGVHISDWNVQIGDKKVDIWTGSDQFKVNMANELVQRPFKEMWNVIGRIDGSEQDALAVVIAANRDSACYGASEASGTAVLLELMSVLSEMKASMKWSPLRSIYFISFSGSKYNQAGAANLAVRRSEFFKRNVFAYIDLSDAVAGSKINFSGDPLFYNTMINLLHDTMDPIQNVSLSDMWDKKYDYSLDVTKSYMPFVSHFSIPSLDLSFEGSGERRYPKNSCLDTFQRFKKMDMDSEMNYHKTLTSLLAKVLLELSDKPIIPLDIYALVSLMNENAKDLRNYANLKLKNSNIHLDFSKFEQALVRMKEMGREQQSFFSTWMEIVDSSSGIEPNLLAVNRWDWNTRLSVLQKILSSSDGIYNRPWCRNMIFGQQLNLPEEYDDSGNLITFRYNSYPGVRDALNDGNWKDAQTELDRTTSLINELASVFQIP